MPCGILLSPEIAVGTAGTMGTVDCCGSCGFSEGGVGDAASEEYSQQIAKRRRRPCSTARQSC